MFSSSNTSVDDLIEFFSRLGGYKNTVEIFECTSFVNIELLKKILKHPRADAAIEAMFGRAGSFELYPMDATFGELLNDDECFEVLMRHRGAFFSRFEDIRFIVDLFGGLDFSKFRRATRFMGSEVEGCVIEGDFDAKMSSLCSRIKSVAFKEIVGLGEDVMPYLAFIGDYQSSHKSIQTRTLKLNEFWFQENPQSMLRWASPNSLHEFKERFSEEEIEQVRLEMEKDGRKRSIDRLNALN